MFERLFKTTAAPLFAIMVFTAATGCEPKGPAQQAGESIDRGVQKAKDVVNPPGPMEKAGRTLDKVGKP